MYEDRICAFVDLLGFQSLVDASTGDASRAASILAALNSLQPHAIAEEMYARVEHDRVPPEQLEAVKEAARLMSASLAKDAEVRISYFSDSIFLSVAGGKRVSTRARMQRAAPRKGSGGWQVFGLLGHGDFRLPAYPPLPSSPWSHCIERSRLHLPLRDQFQTYTGFPIKSDG